MLLSSKVLLVACTFLPLIQADGCTQGKCIECEDNFYSIGQAACASCISLSILSCSKSTGLALVCSPGYGLSDSCSICPSTSWSDGTTPCQHCKAPNYASCSPATGKTTSCNAGYELIFGICSPCAFGHYSLTGSLQPCIPCVSSLSIPFPFSCSPTTGVITTCEAGFGLANSRTCLSCGGGTYSPADSSQPCLPCSAGQFSLPQSASCSYCLQNTYSNVTGASACVTCENGLIAPFGATSCSSCPVGTWDSGADRCDSCMGLGVASCGPQFDTANSCNAGYELIGGGCSACSAGSYSVGGLSTSCTVCPINQYSLKASGLCSTCLLDGVLTCGPFSHQASACIPGYGLSFGMCSICSVGYASNGYKPCNPCGLNEYSQIGASSCLSCLEAGDGIASCGVSFENAYSCIPGFGYNSILDTCTPCLSGTWSNGNTVCLDCLKPSPHSATCLSTSGAVLTCVPGATLVSGSCLLCFEGSFSPGTVDCTQCPINTFASTTGSVFCTNCTAGQTSIVGSSSCVDCPIGQFSLSGTACSNCIVAGVATCGPTINLANTCSPGYGFLNGICKACLGGTSSAGGTATCISCPAGQFAAAQASICSPCSADFYSAANGTTTCSACVQGQISSSGSTICANCPTGQWKSGVNTCTSCMGATNSGIATCGPVNNSPNTCLAGYGFNSNINLALTSCLACQAGTSSDGGTVNCSPCSIGESSMIASSCKKCSINTFAATIGSPICSKCDPGQTSPVGAASCTLCTTGLYMNGIDCENCIFNGVATCGPISILANTCSPGFGFLNGICKPCLGGTYSAGGTAKCLNCDVGSWSNGATACALCTSGSVATCSPISGAIITCMPNFALTNGLCLAGWARFKGGSWYGGDLVLPSLTSSTIEDCFNKCLAYPLLGTFAFSSERQDCPCKTFVTSTVQFTFYPGTTYARGVCSYYAAYVPYPCENVLLSVETGCLGLDGVTPCSCYDDNALDCTLDTGLSTKCKPGFNLVAGMCK